MYPHEPDVGEPLREFFNEHSAISDAQQIHLMAARTPLADLPAIVCEITKILQASVTTEATDLLTDLRHGMIWGPAALAQWDLERRGLGAV